MPATLLKPIPFHGLKDRRELLPAAKAIEAVEGAPAGTEDVAQSMSYDVQLHQHPLVSELIRRLTDGGVGDPIADLQAADTSISPVDFFDALGPTRLVAGPPYPQEEIDTSVGGPYAIYNWELFFHIPITIAIQLSKNGRFEQARKWFHYVFDPTTTDTADEAPARYWKFKEFKAADRTMIQDLLVKLASGKAPGLAKAIAGWADDPFRPDRVAAIRPVAYMLRTVMAYLDNLIAWGDSLFREETREAINEAVQLYVLAANLLGNRPQPLPYERRLKAETYESLRGDLDEFGNALRDFEADLPLEILPFPGDGGDSDAMSAIQAMGRTLYFCVPKNDRLLQYWDTVADRLFKIRNSLNFEGVFRQLPLFPPPIDPALLAAGVAAGLDIGAIVSGAQQPVPLVRFLPMAQKASELCQEVRSLGGQLLSVFEKLDGERLSILRAGHELKILEMGEAIKFGQLQEAKKSVEGLEQSFSNAVARYQHFEQLLGKQLPDVTPAMLEPFDSQSLVDQTDPPPEPQRPPEKITYDVLTSGGFKVSSQEKDESDKLSTVQDIHDSAATMEAIGAFMHLIPQFDAAGTPIGVGAATSFGGANLASIFQGLAATLRAVAGRGSFEASRSGKSAGYARREQDWAYQANLAAGEINQIYKQLRGAQIRAAIAQRELKSHRQQMKNAQEIQDFLTDETIGKTTNQVFYAWMKAEVRGLHSRALDLAYDVARKAERALQHELGDTELRFLQPSYQGGHEGLLSGDRLFADLKRMEAAYYDLNARELELTKHVSLLAVDPLALLQLRYTGGCQVELPEVLFDLDAPGHYFRRIKTVGVSIPCVTGPYAGVHCKLALLKSEIRTSPDLPDGKYARIDEDDKRFSQYFGVQQSIVTSTATNDAGLFETNLRDERVLPFEGLGAAMEVALELPSDVRQFDYGTISDVILHVRYTARDGGPTLAAKANDALVAAIETASAQGSTRLFSIRQEFPSEWARFKATAAGQRAGLTITLTRDHYPFWSSRLKGKDFVVKGSPQLFAPGVKALQAWKVATGGTPDLLSKGQVPGLVGAELANAAFAEPTGNVTLYLDDNSMEDLFLLVPWGKK